MKDSPQLGKVSALAEHGNYVCPGLTDPLHVISQLSLVRFRLSLDPLARAAFPGTVLN